MNADPISRQKFAGAKRPIEAVTATKRLRSKIPRRRRVPPPSIVVGILNSDLDSYLGEVSSSSCLQSELSFDSTLRFDGSEVLKCQRSSKSKKSFSKRNSNDEFRRITRSYARKKEMLRKEVEDLKEYKATETLPEISESSCLESVSDAKSAKISKSTVDLESDLACLEQLPDSGDECSEYNSSCNEMTVSETESGLFYVSSEVDSSDYSFSDLIKSPDDFSERSCENSSPSAAFALFLQFAKQLVKWSSVVNSKEKLGMIGKESSQEFKGLIFEEEVDEESYKNIRRRERSEVFLHDFADDFCSKTEYGDLILQQRLLMVNWTVEHSKAMELQHETLFLGVSLMDRFLSRGYFESAKNLQLLGIASITLATRIEEVQPCNSIRQRSFTVGTNFYTRCEVVAMEWLLLDVLNFQCMIPTTHNFLWFYLKAANADAEAEALSRYLAVLSLLDHERLGFWPSTVAAGLVILACLAKNRDSSCLRVMETHVRSRSDDLPECIQSLEWLVKYAG